ncbi:uncharacterized protein [Halyomorpha halys]|uniref:uncharacterized protein n=1 Tax=Halyomorpha halys TaxID=286706 RepID=UPI0034D25691
MSGLEDDIELKNRLSESVLTEHVLLHGIPLRERPPLPRVSYNKNMRKLTCLMNNVIQEHLVLINGLQDISHWIYIASKTVILELGKKLEDGRNSKTQRGCKEIPQWKKRLQRKINNLREKIGVISNYIRNPHNTRPKTKKKIDEIIVQNLGTVLESELFDKLTLHLNYLKQKLAVYANRVRRYTEEALRRHQNQLIKQNERQFYRSLGQNGKSTIHYPDDIEVYWRNVWEKSACHNENASWIEEEMRSFENASEMPEVTISVYDVMETVSNMKNGRAPGSDGIQNYWIKRFRLYQLLANGFQDVLDGKQAPQKISQTA